jgi:hypothetical protein
MALSLALTSSRHLTSCRLLVRSKQGLTSISVLIDENDAGIGNLTLLNIPAGDAGVSVISLSKAGQS